MPISVYKTKNVKGGLVIGIGKVDFMESKYKEKQNEPMYKFDKFNKATAHSEDDSDTKKKKKLETLMQNICQSVRKEKFQISCLLCLLFVL